MSQGKITEKQKEILEYINNSDNIPKAIEFVGELSKSLDSDY